MWDDVSFPYLNAVFFVSYRVADAASQPSGYDSGLAEELSAQVGERHAPRRRGC
jgi:hypothetical protein